jgi:heat shock protein HslJ
VSGTVGCNSFGGDYTIEGETITFSAINSTLMACADPIMQQESAVLGALVDTVNFKVSGNTLTITSVDGSSALTFERK